MTVSKVTALWRGKAVEVRGDRGVNGPVLCPRGLVLKQMVAWLGKVTCLSIVHGVLELPYGNQLTVNDPLSSGEWHTQQFCPVNVNFDKGIERGL